MSEDFFRQHPELHDNNFRPTHAYGKAINGSGVLEVGIVKLSFRIDKVHMSMNFRIVRGLIHPLILGWDFLTKYQAWLDPAKGRLQYLNGMKSVPLIEDSQGISGCYYRVHEDLTIPGNSKMHTEVELMVDAEALKLATNLVTTEPFPHQGGDVWSCRTCSPVKEGRIQYEFINTSPASIKIEAGTVLGYAEFTEEESFNDTAEETEMLCAYKGYDSGYESEEESEKEEDIEEIEMEREPSKQAPTLKGVLRESPEHAHQNNCSSSKSIMFNDHISVKEIPPRTNHRKSKGKSKVPRSGISKEYRGSMSTKISDEPPPTPGELCESLPAPTVESQMPPGAKRLSIDYSIMAKDALPYKEELQNLLEGKHAEVFAKHDRDYGKTDLIHFRANLKDRDAPPIAVPPYRTRPEVKEIIDRQAYEMIADGLVSPSTSPYSAPILVEKKKLGGYRFLTDFRCLNERCNKIVYPLPRIEDSIQRLAEPKFFSSMDLIKGFWQIPIHPEDKKFFAFSTENMHLEYQVAPMGSKNSPACLSSLMQLVLRGLPPQHVISYLDDILCADSTMEEHLKHLGQVLAALEKAGLKLNPAKCSFAQDSVICLGHKLSRDGISPDPANIEKIRNWQAPENAKKLRTFLGLSGYYRQFVKDYSEIAKILTDLTHENAEWKWTKEHQQAFETLRDILTSDKVMHYPDFNRQFILKSDASLASIGYILTQKFDGKERVISYGSKKLARPQQNWST